MTYEPGGSRSHSEEFSNNPYPAANHPSPRTDTNLSAHLRLGLAKGLFLVGLSVKILKAFLPSSILATLSAHHNLLHLITLTILGERYKL